MAKAANVSGSEGWDTVVEPYPPSWTPENEGEMLQGVFESVKTIQQDGLDGLPRDVNIYTIVTPDGKRAIWGSYAIDLAFESIHQGQEVRVIYEGKVTINNGAQTVKQFTVQTKSA